MGFLIYTNVDLVLLPSIRQTVSCEQIFVMEI